MEELNNAKTNTYKHLAATNRPSQNETKEFVAEHKEIWKEQIEGAENPFNFAQISGEIITEPEFHHSSPNIDFYQFTISVERLSGTSDELLVIVPQNLLDKSAIKKGLRAEVTGSVRIYSTFLQNGKRKTQMYVLASAIASETERNKNLIVLTGEISRNIEPRRTPLGRTITDFFLIVQHRNGAKLFVPCIAWGKLGFAIEEVGAGQTITVCGRMQSRGYTKQLETGETIKKTTYEVSLVGFSST